MSIKTLMIIVIGLIALFLLLTFFMYGMNQEKGILDQLFGYFDVLGGGA